MAKMFFYTTTVAPKIGDPDGTYYVKTPLTLKTWVKQGGVIRLTGLIDIANMDNYWYGIRKFKNDDSKTPTRIGSLQMLRDLPVQSQLYRYLATPDGDIRLGENDSRVNVDGNAVAIDGSLGNLFLHIPDFYFKVVDTEEYTDWRISLYALPGFDLISVPDISPVYSTYDNVNNKAASVCNLTWDENGEIVRDASGFPVMTANAAQFRGANNSAANDGTAKSGLGMARTSVNFAGINSHCIAVGDGYHNNSGLTYSVLALLYYIEYANFDLQEDYNPIFDSTGYRLGGLGRGTSVSSSEWIEFNGYYPFIPSLVTATLGNKTGVVDYLIKEWKPGVDKTVQVSSYRGFECPAEYLFLTSSDFAIWHQADEQGGKSLCYHCDDLDKIVIPTENQTIVPEGYKLVAELPRNDGYIRMVSPNIFMMPTLSTGGSANKAYCDYFNTPVDDASPAYGWFSTRLGGPANTREAAGWRSASTNYRFSHAISTNGFRLCRKKRKSE